MGPSLLVLGQHPAQALRGELLADSRSIGIELAAQGLGVLTLGEAGLTEALAESCEAAGGRVLRSQQHRQEGLDFRSELKRRTAIASFAHATIALQPSTEAITTLYFLSSLARLGILAEHSILLMRSSQWNSAHLAIFHEAPLATRLIENAEDLLPSLDFG